MIEGGYFYKQITKPIYLQQSIVPATGSPLSQLYAGDYVQQEVNGDHAYVQGIELAYQQHLSSLPGVLGGARIIANFAYTNSKNYNLTNRTDTPQLVGQAPFSWNIGPSYATKRALVTVGCIAQQRKHLCLPVPEHRAGCCPLRSRLDPTATTTSTPIPRWMRKEPITSPRASPCSPPDRT